MANKGQFQLGHAKIPGCGRKAGVKSRDTEFRESLQRMYDENKEEIEERLFRELMSLKGYAFISGWQVIVKKLMPDLQSTTIEAMVSQGGENALITKIKTLSVSH